MPTKLRSLLIGIAMAVTLSGPLELAAATDSDALARDIVLLVEAAEQRIWSIDRYEIDQLMGQALLAVCRASTEARTGAVRLLGKRIKDKGGPAVDAWKKNNRKLSSVSAILTQERSLKLLSRAIAMSTKDCPFYLTQEAQYHERNRPVRRSFFGFEGGGLFNLRRQSDETRIGGGGAGRVIYGYGLSPDWAFRIGVESGGAGFLHRELETEDIDVDMYFGVPLIVRHRGAFWHQDIELAGVGVGVPWRDDLRWGGRLAGLIGITYPRLGAIQPWFGLRMGVEYCPSMSGEPHFFTMRIGFRVGVDIHLDGR